MAQDALTLLDEDHQRVEQLFRDYQNAGTDRTIKMDLAQVICLELQVHAQIEEELFYPAYAKATGDQPQVQEAQSAHQEVKDLIGRVQGTQDPDALVLELQRAVQQHVQEERQEMFPKARSSGMDLTGLGRQLEQRRTELAGQVQAH